MFSLQEERKSNFSSARLTLEGKTKAGKQRGKRGRKGECLNSQRLINGRGKGGKHKN